MLTIETLQAFCDRPKAYAEHLETLRQRVSAARSDLEGQDRMRRKIEDAKARIARLEEEIAHTEHRLENIEDIYDAACSELEHFTKVGVIVENPRLLKFWIKQQRLEEELAAAADDEATQSFLKANGHGSDD